MRRRLAGDTSFGINYMAFTSQEMLIVELKCDVWPVRSCVSQK